MSTVRQQPFADTTRLIVCEKSGEWAKRLRRSLPDRGRWIVETRSANQTLATAEKYTTSFTLLEVTANHVPRAATLIEEIQQRFPKSRISVALPPNHYPSVHGETPWLIRELGVVSVLHSSRGIRSFAHLWGAHCRIHPPKEQTLRQRVFEKLPWRNA